MERINLHCNANAFYDSVKCLYIPSVRNCPVAVCGNMEDRFCVNEEPDCGNHSIIPRYRKVVVPVTHTPENHDFISSDQRSKSSISKSLLCSARSGNMLSS